jgi:ubiquinone/menaquinone biosynthesis C-methylase UbiE
MVDPSRTELSSADIHRYWTQQAREHGEDPGASWSDTLAIELEIKTIAPMIPVSAKVADLGCGNGWSTVNYAVRAAEVVGIDYVPELVESARRRATSLSADLAARLRFETGDVRALGLDDASVDCVVMTRVLINMATDDERQRALAEVGRVLRPGGVALVSEATLGGWRRLNALRAEWGLEAIPVPAFNRYVDEEKFGAEAGPALELVDVIDFASTYFVITRVLKPLLARLPGVDVDPANPRSELNRWAVALPAAGDYGTQKLFVLSRTAAY